MIAPPLQSKQHSTTISLEKDDFHPYHYFQVRPGDHSQQHRSPRRRAASYLEPQEARSATSAGADSKMGVKLVAMPDVGGRHSGAVMLALSAGTTFVALLGLTGLSGLLDSSDDLEDEAQSDALEVAVVFCRIWLLASAVIGVLSVRGSLQNHLPSLRIFALHSLIDTALGACLVIIFGLILLSGSVSQGLGHAVCEHLSRGDAWGLVASPGSGLELCEERWNYGLAPFLLLLGGIALFIRTKSAIFIYDYYRRIASEGKISLESPSVLSLQSTRPSCDGRRLSLSYNDQHYHQQPSPQPTSTTSSRPRTNTTSSRHSRASSSSTVRPFRSATASRIMLLPPDYQPTLSASPSLQVTPPSPHLAHSNSSCDSIDTVKGVSTCSSSSSSNSTSTSRKRAMSHDSASHASSHHVVVYAPVLMSIEEAQQLGGKEAVIASSALTSGMCSSPTNYLSSSSSSTSPRLRNVSPPHSSYHLPRNQEYHPDTAVKSRKASISPPPRRSDSEGSNGTIVPDSTTPMMMSSPFGIIKGYRDTTEMEDLASLDKKA